jgi:hypothetical protein
MNFSQVNVGMTHHSAWQVLIPQLIHSIPEFLGVQLPIAVLVHCLYTQMKV